MTANQNKKLIFFAGIAVFSFLARLIPHLPNFTPVGALFLFAGIYFKKTYSFLLPLLVMLVSDFFIGLYDAKLMAVVYFSFLLMGLTGLLIRNKSFRSIAIGTLAASFVFFLVTNFAVWQLNSWYPESLNGLILSYALAIPFFKNSLMGDLFFVSIFCLLYELIFGKELNKVFNINNLNKIYGYQAPNNSN